MSYLLIRVGRKIVLLVILFLCALHPGTAICQTGGPGASADPAKQPTAIPDVGTLTTSREPTGPMSKKGTFILTEIEPLLLLLFGLLLFSVATCIKLKMSRVNLASNQYFEPFVSRSASRPETRS